MKNCELCKVPARTFCESDQASLCWDCDANVHGANFLVARHSRTLLCHACHSPTPWKASGSKLGNTVSLCESCAGGVKVDAEEGEESEGGNDDDIDSEDDDLDDDEVGGEEDGDNQVVPWSSTPSPPASSSSSSEESVSRRCKNGDENISKSVTATSLKRQREDHNSQDCPNNSLSRRRYGADWKAVAWLACDGERPPRESPMRSSDGETRFEGPYGCCDDGRASEN